MEAKVTTRKLQNACLEIGIVVYPDCLASAVLGLTEFFMVANRYANCHKETQGLSIRVTHWRTSLRGGRRIQCVYDSHRGMGRGAPCILIAPPSIANPISSEAAAPYVDWLAR